MFYIVYRTSQIFCNFGLGSFFVRARFRCHLLIELTMKMFRRLGDLHLRRHKTQHHVIILLLYSKFAP